MDILIYNELETAKISGFGKLVDYLKEFLAEYNPKIRTVTVEYGPNRAGDIPHSLASIEKAKKLLGYDPQFSMQQGLKEAVHWYWENLRE